MGVWIVALVYVLLLAIVWFFVSKRTRSLHDEIARLHEENNIILSQKKSSEVRLGKIGEHIAPFLTGWPWDPNNFRFLATPVDGIQFTDDEIIFLEIKTGGSKLSKRQKEIRDLVDAGKVSFKTFLIDHNGCHIK